MELHEMVGNPVSPHYLQDPRIRIEVSPDLQTLSSPFLLQMIWLVLGVVRSLVSLVLVVSATNDLVGAIVTWVVRSLVSLVLVVFGILVQLSEPMDFPAVAVFCRSALG